MEKCDKCGTEADLDFMKRCEPCFRDYVMHVEDKKFGLGVLKNGYSVTAAHYDDIVRRKFDNDGKVYRDRGRTSVSVNGYSRGNR